MGCSVLLPRTATTISVSTAAGGWWLREASLGIASTQERIAGRMRGVRVTRSVELSLGGQAKRHISNGGCNTLCGRARREA